MAILSMVSLLTFVAPHSVVARLGASLSFGAGIIELTTDTFERFVTENDRVMIDFVSGTDNQTEQLQTALLKVRSFGSRVPLARVDATKSPELATRFMPSSCDTQTKRCHTGFPQLLWFVHGQATRYHRRLVQASHISSFVLAMDRPYLTTIIGEEEFYTWNRLVLYRGRVGSSTYKSLERVASQHMDTLAIAHLESEEESVTWIVDNLVTDTFDGNATDVDSVEDWVGRHLIWSEDAPLQVNADDAVVVVGRTFHDLVLRDDRDVFLMVYAPWCGFSRKTLPIWAKFAQEAASVDGLLVAKMDGTQNAISVLDFNWNTYPTLVYFRRGVAKPITFDGESSLENFIDFAKKHSSSPLNFQPSLRKGLVLLQKSAGFRRGDL